MQNTDIEENISQLLSILGIQEVNPAWSTGLVWAENTGQDVREITSPVNGRHIASVAMGTAADYN